MKTIVYFIMMFVLFLLVSCSQGTPEQGAKELHISAASSLTAPLNQIKVLYEERHPEVELIINYGSSGTLVNQLDQGAPADLAILASVSWMERAMEQEIISEENIVDLFTNQLVLAIHEDSPVTSLDNLEGTADTIAIGDPDSVPVGSYTKQALVQLGLWENFQDKIVLAKSARQVAAYIESGNTDAGFILQSDAKAFPDLESVETLPESLHDPIVYPAAVINRSGKKEEGETFLTFLTSDEAIRVLQDYGFQEIR